MSANRYKIGLIGEESDIRAFRALGLDLFPVADPAEVGGILPRLIKSREYGIILITEAVGEAARGIVEEAAGQALPSLVFIPGSQGSRGFARERLRKIVERAVGVDILAGKEGR
ncbi:MAG: V-type ATP synthase subunit F [Bacteroidota bacterium]